MSLSTILALIAALTALITAVTGLIAALKAHSTINNEVKPNVAANSNRLAEVKQEVEDVKNGKSSS